MADRVLAAFILFRCCGFFPEPGVKGTVSKPCFDVADGTHTADRSTRRLQTLLVNENNLVVLHIVLQVLNDCWAKLINRESCVGYSYQSLSYILSNYQRLIALLHTTVHWLVSWFLSNFNCFNSWFIKVIWPSLPEHVSRKCDCTTNLPLPYYLPPLPSLSFPSPPLPFPYFFGDTEWHIFFTGQHYCCPVTRPMLKNAHHLCRKYQPVQCSEGWQVCWNI